MRPLGPKASIGFVAGHRRLLVSAARRRETARWHRSTPAQLPHDFGPRERVSWLPGEIGLRRQGSLHIPADLAAGAGWIGVVLINPPQGSATMKQFLFTAAVLFLGMAFSANGAPLAVTLAVKNATCSTSRGFAVDAAEGPADSTYFVATVIATCPPFGPATPAASTLGKLDGAGNLIWERSYKFSAHSSEQALVLAVLSDSSVVTAGRSNICTMVNSMGNCTQSVVRGTLSRHSSEGVLIWEKFIHTPGSPPIDLTAIAVGPGDTLFVAGVINGFGSVGSAGLVMKLDQNGVIERARLYSSANRVFRSVDNKIAVRDDGSGAVSFNTQQIGIGSYHNQVIRFTSAGNIAWQREIGVGSQSGGLRGLFIEDSGKVLAASQSTNLMGFDVIGLLRFTPTGLVDTRSAIRTASGLGGQLRRVGTDYQMLIEQIFDGPSRQAIVRLNAGLDTVLDVRPFPAGAGGSTFSAISASGNASGWWLAGYSVFPRIDPSIVRLGANLEGPALCGATNASAVDVDNDAATIALGQLAEADVLITVDPRQRSRLADLLDPTVPECLPPPSPRLRFESSSLSFGDIQPGSCGDAVASVLNSGTLVGQVSAVAIQGSSVFSVASEDCTSFPMPPGARCSIAVRFCPVANGEFTAALNVSSNDPEQPLVSLPVIGASGGAIFANGFE